MRDRRRRNEWLGVCVIDGSQLIDWLQQFPAVEQRLARGDKPPANQIGTPCWSSKHELKTIGDPPPLPPSIFLLNRDAACEKLREVFTGAVLQLKLETRYPDQVANFIAAYVAMMDVDLKVDATGRCLIISGADGWDAITTVSES